MPPLMKMSRSCTPWLCVIGDSNPVHNILGPSRRQELRSIACEVGLSFGTVQSILNDTLGMSEVLARWVPGLLTDDQKRTRLNTSRYLLSHYEVDPGDFINRVVTQNEACVHHFDSESKIQSKQWKHPAHPLLNNLRGFIQQGR